ncbi:MAG: hypothetical protein AAFY17_03770 [Cyanobacteria bacterium J06642_11]
MGHLQLICLANSWKHGHRCIAGVSGAAQTWVRPMGLNEHGSVPTSTELIYGTHRSTLRDLKLLDIVELPLEPVGPAEFDFECENRTVLPGPWQVVGRAQIDDIVPLLQPHGPILHNSDRYVTVSELHGRPFEQRKTLQLVYTDFLHVTHRKKRNGDYQWKATLKTRGGYGLTNAAITDPHLVALLRRNIYPKRPCLVTVSLSMPYGHKHTPADSCWKLVAGVIELSLADQILVELHLAGWTIGQGQRYAMATYGKMQRSQLTDSEKICFIEYLKHQVQPRSNSSFAVV